MSRLVLAVIIAFGLAVLRPALAAEPLVEAPWLRANLGNSGIVVLDVQPPGAFAAVHVAGAVNTDFAKSGWRVERNKIPDMMNDPDKLEAIIGALGVDNATHVVLVPQGASAGEMGVATRIYWTFKVLGHDRVSILNGGLAAWMADKTFPLASGPAPAIKAKTFKAALRPELVASKEDVLAAMVSRETVLVDSRTEDQHVGVNRNPKAKRNGTIPGAVNVPHSWMTENNGGIFRNPEALRALFRAGDVAPSRPQIHFCNTGHVASVTWFVAHELLGNTKTALYDGSMVEWTADDSAPVERKIKY